MGLVDFQVILDNPIKVFFSGQTVSGRVLVTVSEAKKMARLKVELVGRGQVHWTEQRQQTRGSGENRRTETVTEHYRASEPYLEQSATLQPGPLLPAGSHVFPFTFLLPPNLPSSFESKIGHVRYYVKADIVRDWRWNHKVKEHVTVNGVLDLNQFPSALQSGRSQDHKVLCCLCCKSGPVSAMIATNRMGYVPGELIGFSAEVDNQSNREMSGSFLNLVEVVTYQTSRKNRTERRVVAEIRRGRIGPGCQDMWEDVKMRVPALPPTNLAGACSIIQVQYKLDFHVDPSGMSMDLVVSLPITVGTIPPLQYIPSLAAPPPDYLNAPSAPLPPYSTPEKGGFVQPAWQPSAPPPPFSPYPDLPPPTYAESVWGASDVRDQEDDEHTGGQFEFVPRYVTYTTRY